MLVKTPLADIVEWEDLMWLYHKFVEDLQFADDIHYEGHLFRIKEAAERLSQLVGEAHATT